MISFGSALVQMVSIQAIVGSAGDLSCRHVSVCGLPPSIAPVLKIPGTESEFCRRKDKTQSLPEVPSLILALPT